MRAATRVSGRVGGEDADGEGAGETLDGAADGFIERDCGRVGFVRALAEPSDTTAWDSLAETVIGCRRAGAGEPARLYFILDEVGDDLGVGFGLELVALGDEGLLELEIVLDDAVVDDDEGAGAVAVGVGILFRGPAVGGPAGVADAVGAVERERRR